MDNQSRSDLVAGITAQHPVVVVGAGMSGLMAAYRLQQAGLPVVVLERDNRIGGRVHTDAVQGHNIDTGAEFLAHFYRRTFGLIDELGLADELVRIPSSAAILRDGRLHKLWPNLRLIFTPLIPITQKLALLRLLATIARHTSELDIHALDKAAALDVCSVSEYANTHLSAELLEYAIQPALAGVFAWSPEHTSLAMLLLTLKAGLSDPRGMQLYTMRHGLSRLPCALAAGLDVRTNAAVQQVTPRANSGYSVAFTSDGQTHTLQAAGVVCATTASAVPALLPWLPDAQRRFFAAVRYSVSAKLAVGTTNRLPDEFYSVLFSRCDAAFLSSATIQSVKNPRNTAPTHDLINLHLGGPGSRKLIAGDDTALAQALLTDTQRLAPTYYPNGNTVFRQIYRWSESLPEFDTGYFQRLQQFAQADLPQRLVFAGDYLGGPFIEGAVTSGEQAAARLVEALRSQG